MHHADGLRSDFGAAGGGLGLFESGASPAAVDGLNAGGCAGATGAMHEGARDLAHQAKIREAQDYLRKQNAEKQQQRLGLPHPPQPQCLPQPPPPALPPPPPPQQSVTSPTKRGFVEMLEGDSRPGALPASVQQPQLSLTEAGQEPPGESDTLKAKGERYALSVSRENDKGGQETLPTPRCATPSVAALSVPDAPGAKVLPVSSTVSVLAYAGHTHLHTRTHAHTVAATGPSVAAADPRATGAGDQVPVSSAAAVAKTATEVGASSLPLAQVHSHPQVGGAPVQNKTIGFQC